jgi:hypothetical protein
MDKICFILVNTTLYSEDGVAVYSAKYKIKIISNESENRMQ